MTDLRPAAWPLPFIALASVDALLIALNAADRLLALGMPWWMQVTQDRGVPEGFNYAKWTCIAAIFTARYLRDRRACHVALALVFLLLLLDDALSLHETAGGIAAEALGLAPMLGVRSQDMGELLVFAVEGAVVVTALGIAWRRGEAAERPVILVYMLLLAALACCCVVFDLLHVGALQHGGAVGLSRLLGAAEDGGEMLIASLILAVTLAPPARFRLPPPALVAPGHG